MSDYLYVDLGNVTVSEAALLWPSLGSRSLAAILARRKQRSYGIAIVDALVQWSRKRGWNPTLLLEGYRGDRSLPSEDTVTSSLEAALDSRPKGSYAIRVLLNDIAA